MKDAAAAAACLHQDTRYEGDFIFLMAFGPNCTRDRLLTGIFFIFVLFNDFFNVLLWQKKR